MTTRNTNHANKTPSTTFQRFLVYPGPALVDPNHRQHLSEIVTKMSVADGEIEKQIDPGMTYAPKSKVQTQESLRISQNLCGVWGVL